MQEIISPEIGSQFFEISDFQRELFFASKIVDDPSVFNVPLALELFGKVDHERLREAFLSAASCHHILCSTVAEAQNRPVFERRAVPTLDIQVFDYSQLPTADRTEAVAAAIEADNA